jgi:hypothetical protein
VNIDIGPKTRSDGSALRKPAPRKIATAGRSRWPARPKPSFRTSHLGYGGVLVGHSHGGGTGTTDAAAGRENARHLIYVTLVAHEHDETMASLGVSGEPGPWMAPRPEDGTVGTRRDLRPRPSCRTATGRRHGSFEATHTPVGGGMRRGPVGCCNSPSNHRATRHSGAPRTTRPRALRAERGPGQVIRRRGATQTSGPALSARCSSSGTDMRVKVRPWIGSGSRIYDLPAQFLQGDDGDVRCLEGSF